MPSRRTTLIASAAGLGFTAAGCASRAPAMSRTELLGQVRAAEEGFAATMARRDAAAFATFIADDAVFINSGSPLRGKAAITEHWKRFFATPEAPFSWRPEIVEIGAQGSLGYTEGPVLSDKGVAFAKFYTTWQRGPTGQWLVIFDNGYRLCGA